ncbi:MAG: hypothetical protein RL497_262 [Pseudomonadota bacterium]
MAVTKFLVALLCLICLPLNAAILPEESADLLYHSYDGGGVTVSGPSVLVRKNFKETASVYANYYTDMVSSASIDVMTAGSKYSEQRTEYSTGVEYLNDTTIYSLGYTNSSENDYEANTVSMGVAQEFFGDLTTVSMGYSLGDDTVMINGDEKDPNQFEASQKHQRFNLGLSQVITKNWLAALNIESVIDNGYLNNPYRSVRYFDDGKVSFQTERYPQTRNSDAIALRTIYYLPFRASLKGEIKAFQDSWGVKATTYELKYVHPWARTWIFEAKIRSYSQTQADFYADIFPHKNFQTFLARDKELSQFSSTNFGLGVTYKLRKPPIAFLKNCTVNLYWDGLQFDYDNFHNALLSKAPAEGTDAPYKPGEEPLYSFNANVLRLFFTAGY